MPGVIVPQRRNRDAELLGIIQTGMNIAQTVYGIKAANAQAERQAAADARSAELFDIQKQQAQDQIAGNVTGKDLIGRSYREAKGPEVGAVGLRTPEGLKYVVVDPLTAAEQATLQVNKAKAEKDAANVAWERNFKENSVIREYEKGFESQVNKYLPELDAASKINSLEFLNSETADKAMIAALIKASEGAGIITETDTARYGVTGGMFDQARQNMIKLWNGKPVSDPRARQEIVAVANMLAGRAKEKIRKEAERKADAVARQTSLTKEQALGLFDADKIIESFEYQVDMPEQGPVIRQQRQPSLPGESAAYGSDFDPSLSPMLNPNVFLDSYLGE